MATILTGGSETLVNTTVANDQSNPAVATLSDGSYVVTWTSYYQDGSNGGVYMQRYDSLGVAQGLETRVNTTVADSQYSPSVAALSGGGYVVTWTSSFQDGSNGGVYMQRYDSLGVAQGLETRVNTTVASDQFSPSVAALSGGGYVVTWTSQYQDGSSTGVYMQRYDANGVAQGLETLVNTTVAYDQSNPSVAALSGGGYVVTWNSYNPSSFSIEVYAQRYDANGVAQGLETLVNTTVANEQSDPSVAALSGGGYVVTWTSRYQDGDGFGVYMQRYDANGVAQGVETRVNTITASNQIIPSVTALSDGGYVVTWTSQYQDGDGYGVYAQRYDAGGNTVGGEIPVNVTTASNQFLPSVAALPDGRYIVTWQSYNQDANNSDGVYSRIITQSEFTGPLTTATEFVYGTSADETFLANPGALGPNDQLDSGGGNDTLTLNAPGALDLTAPSLFAGIENVEGSSGDDVIVVSQTRLADVQSLDGKGGTDRLEFSDYSLDLSTKTVAGFEEIRSTQYGPSLTLTGAQLVDLQEISFTAPGANGALSVAGGGAADLSGITLTGLYTLYGSGADQDFTLTGAQLASLRYIDAGGGADTLHLSGGGTFNLNAPYNNYVGPRAFEALQGSDADDTFVIGVGFQYSNVITSIAGGGGNDKIVAADGYLNLSNLTSLTGIEKIEGTSGNDGIYLNLAAFADLPAVDGKEGSDSLNLGFYNATGDITFALNDPALVSTLHIGGLGESAISGFETLSLTTGSGNDTLTGGASGDWLDTGEGTDVVNGGAGDDTIFAGEGADIVDGGAGADQLYGGGGNDTLYSRLGEGPAPGATEILDGGAGVDFALVDRSSATRSFNLDLADPSLASVLGEGTKIVGVERIEFRAGSGTDTLSGGELADILSGGSGTDTISGRGGDDTLIGGAGIDTIDGGEGNDTAVFSGAWTDYAISITGDVVDIIDTRTGGDGADRLLGVENFQFADGTHTLANLLQNKAPTAVSFANVITSLAENTAVPSDLRLATILVADDGRGTNALTLSGTNASLFKVIGSDLYLKAGTALDFETAPLLTVTINADDATVGGSPDASSIFNLSITNVAEGGGGGSSDTTPPSLVISSDSTDGFLSKNETTTLTFDFSESVVGFTAADVSISPKIGRLGTLVQDSLDPTIYRAAFTPSKNVSGAVILTVGNAYNDTAGNVGSGASMELYINTRNQTVGTSANNTFSGTSGNDVIDGAGGNDTVNGSGGNDWLLGGDGVDAINGGSGNDWIFGQNGNDRLTGGTGADRFVFNLAGFGNDTITDFSISQGDVIDLLGLNVDYDSIAFAQVGENTQLTIGTDTITLNNVTATNLDAGNFLV